MYWGNGPSGVPTSARVDLSTVNNATWEDAFQFDPTGPTGSQPTFWPPGVTGPAWTLTNQNFLITIKGNLLQTSPLLQIDTGRFPNCALVVVDDVNSRILHMNVPDVVMNGFTGATGCTGAGLIPGWYIYDFIMYDQSQPPVKIALMHGRFLFSDGVGYSTTET
jgi:hypothetical protein